MYTEAEHSARIGFTAILASVIFIWAALMFFNIYTWRAQEVQYKTAKAELSDQAEVYKMTSGNTVSGNDIIEFILRYDAKYEYYINIPGRSEIEVSVRKEELQGSKIWTERYLDALFGNLIDDQYTPSVIMENNEIIGFTFKHTA